MLSHPHPWTPDPQHSFLELLLCVRLQRAPGKLWVMRPGFCPPQTPGPAPGPPCSVPLSQAQGTLLEKSTGLDVRCKSSDLVQISRSEALARLLYLQEPQFPNL